MTLQRQLLIALALPALLVGLGVAYLADRAFLRALEGSLAERLSAIAEAAAEVVGENVLVLEPGDDESRTAQLARKRLDALARSTRVDEILVIGLTEPAILVDSRGARRIGDPYVRARFDAFELERVRAGESVASVLFADEAGRWTKTGYAPIRGDDQVRGAIVVSAPAEFFATLDALRRRLFLIIGLGVVTLTALSAAMARRIAIPLTRLSRAAEAIGRGQLETEIPTGEGPSEARILSETMRQMGTSLAARDRELQMMLAGIAHEVRNPLGGIELFGGLLHEDLEPGDPRRRHVERILGEIRILSTVVNDFLDFARRRPIERRRTSLSALVDSATSALAPRSAERRVEIHVELEPGLVLSLDPDGVQRAVLNLAQNAIQAAPEGGHVFIRARRLTEPDRLRLEVEDDGPGVPEAAREQLFRPFFTTKQKGTGLGLALVKKSIEAHGGRVWLDDRPGGARFVIELPWVAADEAVDEGPAFIG